ncbi:DUF2332 domain-containing protein [Virgibacillus indicus]|uniref:DUF2332 domain-containing protein n=1 Tax=Virgibacillus indicus TaxID=2024554 RepID=UPI001F0B02B2|nr:DUF2332 domain-containing protein [Virgibacillus indicus]
MDLPQLSKRFKAFAEKECAGSSELYEHLSLKIAEDNELLELSSYVREGQPVPNLLLAAIHYLLLKGTVHKLRDYYPNLTERPKSLKNSFPNFKDFCSSHRDQIIPILGEKIVQTNEVKRCGYLYPVFSYIYEKVQKPLALIEIGTSAGLQLLWDKYAYSYNSDEIYGDKQSTVHIKSEIKGKNRQLSKNIPLVTDRYGLDLHINDLSNAEDSLWLNSLIWPEHKERRTLFTKAAACVRNNRYKLQFIEGDGVEKLPGLAEEIPDASAICIYHTHVANQMPPGVKHKLLANVKRISERRDVFHIYNNIWDGFLHLDSYINGREDNKVIAETDGHGSWFKWMV